MLTGKGGLTVKYMKYWKLLTLKCGVVLEEEENEILKQLKLLLGKDEKY